MLLLSDKKTGSSVFNAIILTDYTLCCRVFVVVSVDCAGGLTVRGLQAHRLSRSRRSTPNFPRWNTPRVWHPRTQSHMKGGTHDDHFLTSYLSHVFAITFRTRPTTNPGQNSKSPRVSTGCFLICARYLLQFVKRYNPDLY